MRYSHLAGLLLLVLVGLWGCGNSDVASPENMMQAMPEASAGYADGARRAPGGDMVEAERAAAPPAPAASSPLPAPRKLIVTGGIGVEVEDFTAARAKVEELVAAAGGYQTNSDADKQSNGGWRGSITVKIPPEKLSAFLAAVRALGEVKSENRRGDDVSMEYVDLTARLTTKRQLEGELLGLLHTSSPRLADKLEVERELARVREEIETVQGRLKYIDAMAALATITVTLFEPETVAPEDDSIIFDSFKTGIDGLLRSIGALIIFVMVAAPWLLALIVVIMVIRAWWRRRRGAKA